MNIINTLIYIIFASLPISACPTCVGRVTYNSPLFFSEEFYKKNLHNSAKKNSSHKSSTVSFDKKNNKEHQS